MSAGLTGEDLALVGTLRDLKDRNTWSGSTTAFIRYEDADRAADLIEQLAANIAYFLTQLSGARSEISRQYQRAKALEAALAAADKGHKDAIEAVQREERLAADRVIAAAVRKAADEPPFIPAPPEKRSSFGYWCWARLEMIPGGWEVALRNDYGIWFTGCEGWVDISLCVIGARIDMPQPLADDARAEQEKRAHG